MKELINLLQNKSNVDEYSIVESNISSTELFFIKDELQMNRGKDVTHINVTVYRNFEEQGTTFKGSSITQLSPTMSLDEMEALIDIAALTDERGLKIASTGRKMIIPKELQFTAERIMKSPMRVGTADNDINAINNMGMVPEGYRINNFLTDTDSFFLLTDVPNGMKHFNRSPIKTSMEGDFDTGNVRYKARERYVFGFSDPRGIFGSDI